MWIFILRPYHPALPGPPIGHPCFIGLMCNVAVTETLCERETVVKTNMRNCFVSGCVNKALTRYWPLTLFETQLIRVDLQSEYYGTSDPQSRQTQAAFLVRSINLRSQMWALESRHIPVKQISATAWWSQSTCRPSDLLSTFDLMGILVTALICISNSLTPESKWDAPHHHQQTPHLHSFTSLHQSEEV